MADRTDSKPWAEMNARERTGMAVGVIFVGAIVLGFAVMIVAGAVVSTRDAVAAGPPARVCIAGQRSHCLAHIPAHVRTATAPYFVVSTDRRPYDRELAFPDGRPPAPGTRVTLEEWKGEVIAFIDPEYGRRHTVDWPDRGDAVTTAVVFDLFLLFLLGGVSVCLADWRSGRKEQRESAALGVSERHAQTS